MYHRVLGGQSLVGPAEALGREDHPVTQAGELGEQLLRTRRKDDIVTVGSQITHTVNVNAAVSCPTEQDQWVRIESHTHTHTQTSELPVHKQDDHVLVLRVFEKLLLQPADLLPSTHRPSHITSLPLLSQTQDLGQSH